MTLKELLTWGGGAIFAILSLLEVSKIKINPWSALARVVGRAINKELYEKIGEIEKKLDDHVTRDDRRTADSHRAGILRFNNELLREIGHTKEEFIDVLADIDAYERYCEAHPEYPNNRAVLAIENIREVYKERLKKHDFLSEGVKKP